MMRIDATTVDAMSETALWALRDRAVEAQRPDGVLEDPVAVEVYRSVDCDWGKFGAPSLAPPLRALAFDHAVWQYLATHPRATVVALGEGLQTGYWRLGRRAVRWLSVDLEPVLELRKTVLPQEDWVVDVPASALDRSWMDRVDPADGVVVTAEALLMYFDREESLALIDDCVRRFPGGQLIFDSIPHRFGARARSRRRVSDRYTAPPTPFALGYSEARGLAEKIDGITAVEDVPIPPGRGAFESPILRRIAGMPGIREHRPMITRLRF